MITSKSCEVITTVAIIMKTEENEFIPEEEATMDSQITQVNKTTLPLFKKYKLFGGYGVILNAIFFYCNDV